MTVMMYGIANCDTIKKAKAYLRDQHVDIVFHDYKKQGIDANTLKSWCAQVGWQVLLNKRGTTWRKLTAEEQADLDEDKAIALLVQYPSMIKRPVLLYQDQITVGFSLACYQDLLA